MSKKNAKTVNIRYEYDIPERP
jgi:hypothetical protein